ncbi:MAG: histone deacetylase [Chloroflexota bacterium]
MKRLAIVYQPRLREHDFGPGHPVRARERLEGFYRALQESGLLESPEVSLLSPEEPIAEEDILAVHDRSLVELIQRLSREGGVLDGDTPVPPGTYERTRLQAGGFLAAALGVASGQFQRAAQMPAFGGHHAMRRHGPVTFGFCYFNQEAMVIRHLQRRGLVSRVLVLDTDCHHGNGTQDIFYEDPSVLAISLHQDPHTLYPGVSGFVDEIGEGPGRGFNANLPLPPRTGCASYLKALSEIFPPLAREFRPDVIVALLTGDTHFREPLTDFGLGVGCYPQIAGLVCQVADEVCRGRLLAVVSGGRNLEVGPVIASAIVSTLAGREGPPPQDPCGPPPAEPPGVARAVDEVVIRLKRLLSPHWACFRDT